MNKFTKLLGASLLCFVLLNAKAQEAVKRCGTTEAQQELFDADPALYQEHLKENARLEAIDKEAYANGYKQTDRAGAPPVYIIPVVFHVLHQYGLENISDDQIKDGIRCMTEDFRKQNADWSSTVAVFQCISADSEIEFRLAQKNPNGNFTKGIDRIVSTLTNVTGTSTSSKNAAKLNPWPRANYLNIWVVKSFADGIAGYAQFPGSGATATDGIMLLSDYVGAIGTSSTYRSHTLTHEVGHFLNLNHIWDCCSNIGTTCGSDGVTDTPTTRGHDNTCTTASPCNTGVPENAQNFMDYSYCYTMFTQGQATRMRAALNSTSGQRSSLWTATNLTNTGVNTVVLCKADFSASFQNTNNTICKGSSLTFTDKSWNGTPTGYTWSFPGGTPSTSTSASPVIQYNTAGTYNVSYTVTNSSGTASTTKTAYVNVNPGVATYANPTYTESFEGSAIPNADWKVFNQLPGGNTWVQTTAAGATGTKSVRIANLSTYDTYIDELISPPINMSAIAGTGPVLTFKVAHAQKTSTTTDKLQIYVSTNCGQSWTIRRTITDPALSTAGVSSTWTTPTAGQWRMESVPLASYATISNFYIMFRFTSNGGSNIYIDDINISGTVGIQDELTDALSFNVYPNPIEENTVIGFNLLDKQKVQVQLYDVLGQHVSTIFEGNLSAGEHEYKIADQTNLTSGIYFVKLTAGDHKFTKKLIVK